MTTRAEKYAWWMDRVGPEGFYADGELSQRQAEAQAVRVYDHEHGVIEAMRAVLRAEPVSSG